MPNSFAQQSMPTRIENARRLRQRSTDAERRLWYFLRNRQLDGCRFRRQAPLGRYVADFVCVERRLVIELDGGQHFETATADRERARHFARAGYRVLRFWNTPVLQETTSVLESILAALRETGAGPHAEDDWKRIRIGAIEFEVVKACVRCVFTTVDFERGERDPSGEPLRTLIGYRRTPDGVTFGQNLIPRGSGVLSVGDSVEVLA